MRSIIIQTNLTIFLSVIATIKGIYWLSPFDDQRRLAELCTEDNRQIIMYRSSALMLLRLFHHNELCWSEIEQYVQPRYIALTWFMQSLGYCEVNRIVSRSQPEIEYSRMFQLYVTRAAFALVCQQTNDIKTFQLANYAALFRILFEKNNTDRSIICKRVQLLYKDLYDRCLVYKANVRMRLLKKICSERSMIGLINMRFFFRRFSRNCNTFDDFLVSKLPKYSSFGEALSNDPKFMNLLSEKLVVAIRSDSHLPEMILKTRLLLQHFSIVAVKLLQQFEKAAMCAEQHERIHLLLNNSEHEQNMNNSNNGTDFDYDGDGDIDVFDHCPHSKRFIIHMKASNDIRIIAQFAKIGLFIEAILLLFVLLNTLILSVLLWYSHKKLSTATVLFIINIIFSNTLFIISFIFLLSQVINDNPFGTLDDEILDSSLPAPLTIAEALNAHLFTASGFIALTIQEMLYSLAQNGSLLGLTNLLVLLLVVINRSMAGKMMKLSRKCVILTFLFIWLFLFLTHLAFSSLQRKTIHAISEMFSDLAATQFDVQCHEMVNSKYIAIGNLCDGVLPFYNFGVYLLRGHTFFTLIFLLLALIILALTISYHRGIRGQNMLRNKSYKNIAQRRREMLFNTLLLSLCAYFLSVSGQTFIEIAVFWAQNREHAAEMARWYQLARIAAFVDPLLNPLLVTLRIPTMRTKLRQYWRILSGLLLVFNYNENRCKCKL